MIPFFPSLRPKIANRLYFDVSSPINEETELRYEREHHAWRDSFKHMAADINPLGKILTIGGPETDDEDGKFE